MGLCFTQEKSACWLCAPWGPRWGPTPGVAEWQGSVVTAFLGEVDLSFCKFIYFLVIPQKWDDRRCQRLTPMAKECLSQNRGFGAPTPPLFQGTQHVDVTTWGHLWGHRWDPVQIRSSCSTSLAWPECASRRCTCVKWQCEAGSEKEEEGRQRSANSKQSWDKLINQLVH